MYPPAAQIIPTLSPPANNMDMQKIDRTHSTEEGDLIGKGYGEDTPAYQVLNKHHLLVTKYRVPHVSENGEELGAVVGTSSRPINFAMDLFCCPFQCCFNTFTTPQGKIQLVEDGRGNFLFYGAGVHLICDPFFSVREPARAFGDPTEGAIIHGDRTIVVIPQGLIGFAQDKGQPVLLPPGLHQWKSATLKFERTYDLNNNVIAMGPLTLVTVDEGYAAVTEDNGMQKILEGGETYLLTHRNWKFQKYITQKIQSNDLKRIKATSADNVLMAVDATVIWRINDVATAAKNSADTIRSDGKDTTHSAQGNLGDISKLTTDVLKQAEASLAAFIGAVNYSDTFNVAAAVHKPDLATQSSTLPPIAHATEEAKFGESMPAVQSAMASPLFDMEGMENVVHSANKITSGYGVHIISINVVAAVPADNELMTSLAQGAVAAAEAQKYELVAKGKASAAKIEATGTAEAAVIRAKGDAEAERLRAEGARKAADLIEGSETAVQFSLIDKTGMALSGKSSFFFGSEANNLGSLLVPALAGVAEQGGATGRS